MQPLFNVDASFRTFAQLAHGLDLRLNTRPTDEPFSILYYNRQRASSSGQVLFFFLPMLYGFHRCTRAHTLCLISISIRRNFFMCERPFASTETLLYSILHLLEFKILFLRAARLQTHITQNDLFYNAINRRTRT
jgi:hypothetical protein